MFVYNVVGVKYFCDMFKAHHAYCGKHIQRNANDVTKKAKPRESLTDTLFWKLAKSDTEVYYQNVLKEVRSFAPKTASYLDNIDHSRWVLYAIVEAGYFTHGRMTSNAAEQTNSESGVIGREGACTKHPLKAIEQMLHNLNNVVTKIQMDISERGHLFNVLTPYYVDIYKKTVQERNQNLCDVFVASVGEKETVKYPVINAISKLLVCHRECVVDLSGKPPYGSCQLA